MLNPSQLSTDAKSTLCKVVQTLRAALIEQIGEATEREYRLGTSSDEARLPVGRARRRERLDAWLDEQSRCDRSLPQGTHASKAKQRGARPPDTRTPVRKRRPKPGHLEGSEVSRQRHLRQAVKEAAHTLLNRLIILRILEHAELSKPAVVTGGYKSPGYKEYSQYARALCDDPNDDSKGYLSLLGLLFDELALELLGVFGKVGVSDLLPIPGHVLRRVVEALNDPSLDCAWGDDTTLGWVYQFWNDPEREALDAKIKKRGKITPAEVAAKTQMFTERYMVEWLLQNSLGHTWNAICRRRGWGSSCHLDSRAEACGHWGYWVERPLTDEALAAAPDSLRDLKLLDPACGSGHFLVIAFRQLTALYQEEARHRGVIWSNEQIAHFIVERNLHGVDLDPRAVQIAAAAVWLAAKQFAPSIRLGRLNLVAATFRLADLEPSDPSIIRLYEAVKGETGIPQERLEHASAKVRDVHLWGSLLRLSETKGKEVTSPPDELSSVLAELARFLDNHHGTSDLGLRLHGEQLSAGVRLMSMLRGDQYDVVATNPPYLGIQKTVGFERLREAYGVASGNLYSAFVKRAVELVKPHGQIALVTMRAWMYVSQFARFRAWVLEEAAPEVLCELGGNAFETSTNVEVVMWVSTRARASGGKQVQAYALSAVKGLESKRMALTRLPAPYRVEVSQFSKIRGTPLVYSWSREFMEEFAQATLLGDIAPVRVGMKTSNNARFVRMPWEVPTQLIVMEFADSAMHNATLGARAGWVPYVKGATGKQWFEPLSHVVDWRQHGLAIRVALDEAYGHEPQGEDYYFERGVAYTTIGNEAFVARLHRFRSIFDVAGSSVFPRDPHDVVCLLNSNSAANTVAALNPTINFQVSDVSRIPCFADPLRSRIVEVLEEAFAEHERGRETSVEFRRPAASAWSSVQQWAKVAVNRPPNAPLPEYAPRREEPDPRAHLSFAVGIAMGRFGVGGEGILDLTLPMATERVTGPTVAKAKPRGGETLAHDKTDTRIVTNPLPAHQILLPDGTLFLSSVASVPDSTSHPAMEPLHLAWQRWKNDVLSGEHQELGDWLRKCFFAYHNKAYEGRPIYFPLCSRSSNFVAFVSIHRWTTSALQALLVNHLLPARTYFDGRQNDLNDARASTDKGRAQAAQREYSAHQKLVEELDDFIAKVQLCAEKGPPAVDAECPPREVDAPYQMDLADGVVVNAAGLWPLLEAQWTEPKEWWRQLATASAARGKDFDWARLTARYFPSRVGMRCETDFDLSVAHGCAWKRHPARAYAWELRLRHDIDAEFSFSETGAEEARAAFLRECPQQAEQVRRMAEQRRARKRPKTQPEHDKAKKAG